MDGPALLDGPGARQEGKIMRLFRTEAGDAKANAQRNLAGRTHYVDDDTLRYHKSRVISARHTDGGLLFAIVTSDAKDSNGSKRGFRYVVFDVFGTVVERNPKSVDLEWFTSSERATKGMWAFLNGFDAIEHTRKAIARAEECYAAEIERLRGEVSKIELQDMEAALARNNAMEG